MFWAFKCHGRTCLWCVAVTALLLSSFFPTNFELNYSEPRNGHTDPLVMGIEKVGRHVNTALPFLTVIALRDVNGLWQLASISVAGIAASHGPKRLLNDVEVLGTRLGQRPSSPHSRHNMPSGHSTLASAGAYFVARRYSYWFGVLVWPIVLLTMYARVMLDAHTVSATIAGALTGILVAALFTRPTPRLRRIVSAFALRPRSLTKL